MCVGCTALKARVHALVCMPFSHPLSPCTLPSYLCSMSDFHPESWNPSALHCACVSIESGLGCLPVAIWHRFYRCSGCTALLCPVRSALSFAAALTSPCFVTLQCGV